MIRTIPLSKLVPSLLNVRRVVDEQADRQLKADIEARGLLQNLLVTSVSKPRGRFAVEAGGRRLRALQALATEGKLAKTHEVCCLLLDGDPAVAQEAGLAENFQRLSMNPADECTAFRQLVEQGVDVEGIARRFGLTVRFVEGRLRLAGLAPIVFEALGAGTISLDVAKAYAATPDRERQELVFDQMSRGYGASHPDSIRRMMTHATVSASDRRALFVGEEAYVAAGGRIERDLFSEEAGARWLDIAILERLACEKMEAAAAQVADETGFGFIRPTLDSWIGHALTEGLRRVPVDSPALTEEETRAVDALEAEIEDVADLLQDDETEEPIREEAEAKIRGLNARIVAIIDKPPVVDEAIKAEVGAFLILDDDGRPRLDTTLYAERVVDSGGDAAAGDATTTPEERETKPKTTSLSRRLVDELAIQRRDILSVHVAADPGLALDLATFLMIGRESVGWGDTAGSSLMAAPPSDPAFDFKTPDAAATIARAEADQALDRSWTERATISERFDAFRALPDEARAVWLGHMVARTLEASLRLPGARACAFHDHLGQLLGIDVARWWRPTGANYFDRVPKSVALAALEEVGGATLAGRHAKAKKVELAQACERIFAGDVIAEVEVKEAATAWVPEVMRFGAAETAVQDEDVVLDEPIDAPVADAPVADAPEEMPEGKVEEAA